MFKRILHELKEHAPFTVFGALTGIVIIVPFSQLPAKLAYNIFYVLHPLHVVFSALVTASIYELHRCGKLKTRCNLALLLAIGYIGSVGIATVSDSLIPYLGESLLNMPRRHVHIGFIEEWWLVNPMALIGIVIAYFRPRTKLPHATHVLLSTWASLFHIIMAIEGRLSWFSFFVIFIFLFIAVWVPCCFSDIVFPLLFIRKKD